MGSLKRSPRPYGLLASRALAKNRQPENLYKCRFSFARFNFVEAFGFQVAY
ncbi:hypothetical protein GCWU000324_02809 [Kingella oralis ATCC 51147]|uniref:Uncharacterized protein n=1 Tax=Kingella oralis ATCC 51147 TaxID=629741 RepID=C4GM76_9NEIS|nr:hypothetical protein GCWU000324_02809 [Kingella oralis ATCC 51147]